ncbi:hypothetical protein GGR52DRAFT_34382 [Hypoxylon sp. FL1284]|nr:hypothetical protein GGR52DRAFT_34382 [Hypoxylon sp. FL1284]
MGTSGPDELGGILFPAPRRSTDWMTHLHKVLKPSFTSMGNFQKLIPVTFHDLASFVPCSRAHSVDVSATSLSTVSACLSHDGGLTAWLERGTGNGNYSSTTGDSSVCRSFHPLPNRQVGGHLGSVAGRLGGNLVAGFSIDIYCTKSPRWSWFCLSTLGGQESSCRASIHSLRRDLWSMLASKSRILDGLFMPPFFRHPRSV